MHTKQIANPTQATDMQRTLRHSSSAQRVIAMSSVNSPAEENKQPTLAKRKLYPSTPEPPIATSGTEMQCIADPIAYVRLYGFDVAQFVAPEVTSKNMLVRQSISGIRAFGPFSAITSGKKIKDGKAYTRRTIKIYSNEYISKTSRKLNISVMIA